MALKKTSIYLDHELDRRLADRAAEEGLSKAEFVRRALATVARGSSRPKPAIGVFSSRDGLSAATDLDRMMEGFGEE